MIVGITQNVLFDVFILACVMFVLHPQRNGEIARQIVSHGFCRYDSSSRTIKHVNLCQVFLFVFLQNTQKQGTRKKNANTH